MRTCKFILLPLLYLLQISVSNGTPISASIGAGASDMATVQSINVKCGRSGMNVQVSFDRPFTGVIYSKGNFYDPKCNYVPHGTGSQQELSFLIPIDSCGTVGHLGDPTPEQEMYFENTIVIQNDPLIQEIWDTARSLKCAWKHSFSKSVKTDPIEVKSPQMVTVNFDSRSVNTLMQIQKGKSPFSSPANGYIYVGDDTSLVIYVQDPTGELDVNAVSCTASSGKSEPVELVDRNGCVTRPNLMTPFYKHRNPEGFDADLMLYSYFKAFRIGDDPNFKISCQLEVCEGKCLEPCALGPYDEFSNKGRKRRAITANGFLVKLENQTVILSPMDSHEVPTENRDSRRITVLHCDQGFGYPVLHVTWHLLCAGVLAYAIFKLELAERNIDALLRDKHSVPENMNKILKEILPSHLKENVDKTKLKPKNGQSNTKNSSTSPNE